MARLKVKSREICDTCFSVTRVGYSVPLDTWRAALPKDLLGKCLCLECFTRYCDEMRLHWDKDIKFFPVSLLTSMGR